MIGYVLKWFNYPSVAITSDGRKQALSHTFSRVDSTWKIWCDMIYTVMWDIGIYIHCMHTIRYNTVMMNGAWLVISCKMWVIFFLCDRRQLYAWLYRNVGQQWFIIMVRVKWCDTILNEARTKTRVNKTTQTQKLWISYWQYYMISVSDNVTLHDLLFTHPVLFAFFLSVDSAWAGAADWAHTIQTRDTVSRHLPL